MASRGCAGCVSCSGIDAWECVSLTPNPSQACILAATSRGHLSGGVGVASASLPSLAPSQVSVYPTLYFPLSSPSLRRACSRPLPDPTWSMRRCCVQGGWTGWCIAGCRAGRAGEGGCEGGGSKGTQAPPGQAGVLRGARQGEPVKKGRHSSPPLDLDRLGCCGVPDVEAGEGRGGWGGGEGGQGAGDRGRAGMPDRESL